MKKIISTISILALLASCVSGTSYSPPEKVQLLATHSIDTGQILGKYAIGGLSAIVVLPDGSFITLTDSRSTKKEGPSRFYTGHISFQNGVMKGLDLRRTIAFIKPDGTEFAEKERDPEAFVLSDDGNLLFASERSNTLELASVENGAITKTMDQFLPGYYYGEEGLRGNQGIEGMSLSPDGKYLFLASESALVRDGDVASPENPAVSRILKMEKSGNGYKVLAEYPYLVSKIPIVSAEFNVQDNGVSDILALDEHRLILIERNGYAVKPNYAGFDFNIRLYLVDLSVADNISGQAQVPSSAKMAGKKLLFNLSDFVDTPDNVEGISFGPDIGKSKTIVLVSDNNFSNHQATKFYQFKVPYEILESSN